MSSVAILRPLHAVARTLIEVPVSVMARIKRVATPSRLKKYDRLHLSTLR